MKNQESRIKDPKLKVFNLSLPLCILHFIMFVFVQNLYAEPVKTALGLWVPCEGENKTLSSRSKIIQMLDLSKNLGTNDIFLQVYRRNHSWYRSNIAADLPFKEVWAKEKMDPLAVAIHEAHGRGLRIHAWFNIYWIGKDLNVPIVKKLGKDIITRDQKGRSLIDYSNYKIPPPEGGWYSYGEDGFWLDPGDERVKAYLLDLFREVLTQYPGLDGIHLDFVRYPFTSPFLPGSYYSFNRGIEFGYGVESVKRFKVAYGLDPFAMERTVENHLAWDQWRRDQITDFVNRLRQMLRQNYSDKKLSCAVLPWPERSYFSSFQDWTRWTREGKVDFAVTMNYTVDLYLAKMLSQMNMATAGLGEVWVGLGPYMFESNTSGFERQFKETLNLKPSGIVFFSYETLLKNSKLSEVIKREIHGDD